MPEYTVIVRRTGSLDQTVTRGTDWYVTEGSLVVTGTGGRREATFAPGHWEYVYRHKQESKSSD